MTWEWIWDNCQDVHFMTIKNAAIQDYNGTASVAKQQFCSSCASCFLGTSGSLHLPKSLLGLNITIDDVVDALDDFQDLDAHTRQCIKLVWL